MWVDHLSFQVAHSLSPSFVRPLHSNSLVNIGPWCFSLQSLGELHWIDTTYNIQYAIQQWFLSVRVVLCYFSKILWCRILLLHFVVTLDALQVSQKLPLPRLWRQADYLEIFESGEDLLAKTLRFSWLIDWVVPVPPNKVPPKKKPSWWLWCLWLLAFRGSQPSGSGGDLVATTSLPAPGAFRGR